MVEWNEQDYYDEIRIAFIEGYRKWVKEHSNAPTDAAYSEPIDNRQVR